MDILAAERRDVGAAAEAPARGLPRQSGRRGRPEAHVIGEFRGLQIAELPAHDTPFVGQDRPRHHAAPADRPQRRRILGAGKAAACLPADGDSVRQRAGRGRDGERRSPRSTRCCPAARNVAAGDGHRCRQGGSGGGPGAQAEGPARSRDRPDRGGRSRRLRAKSTQVFTGDAADRQLLDRAGILAARSVVLTTNDDAMNIYLAVFCRRLNPRAAHRQPHHARAESRGDSPRRRGLRAELHDARDRSGDVAAARLSAGAARRGRRAVLRARSGLARRPSAGDSGIGSRTGLSVVALQRGTS